MKGTLPYSLPGAGPFHLFYAASEAPVASRIYFPKSDAPGLSLDVLRVEIIPKSMASVESITRNTIAREAQYVASGQLFAEKVSSNAARQELTIHAWFKGDPAVGDRHVIQRVSEASDAILSMTLMRKLYSLSESEVTQWQALISRMDLTEIWSHDETMSDFATAAIAKTKSLGAERNYGSPLADPFQLLNELKLTSPLYGEAFWALDAVFAIDQLENQCPGRIPEVFLDLPKFLGLAAISLDDVIAEGNAPLALEHTRMHCLDKLARYEIFCALSEGDAPANRSAHIWSWAAANSKRLGLTGKSRFDALAAFATALAQVNAASLPDIDLGPTRYAIKSNEESLDAALEALHGIAENATYLASRVKNGCNLAQAACVATDIAGFLIECESIDGIGESVSGELLDSLIGKHAIVSQAQLKAQSAFFGVDQQAWEMLTSQGFSAGSAVAAGVEPRRLFYIRPLRSSRRVLIENGFGTNPYFEVRQPAAAQLLPAYISIEAALHWGVCTWFKTEALGGPIDIFGMARSSVLGPWRLSAGTLLELSDVICVLASDSEGLAWELDLIASRGLHEKVMLVMPPPTDASVEETYSANRIQLAKFGFNLPSRAAPGFILFDSKGQPAEVLEFGAIWNDKLRAALGQRILRTSRRF